MPSTNEYIHLVAEFTCIVCTLSSTTVCPMELGTFFLRLWLLRGRSAPRLSCRSVRRGVSSGPLRTRRKLVGNWTGMTYRRADERWNGDHLLARDHHPAHIHSESPTEAISSYTSYNHLGGDLFLNLVYLFSSATCYSWISGALTIVPILSREPNAHSTSMRSVRHPVSVMTTNLRCPLRRSTLFLKLCAPPPYPVNNSCPGTSCRT